LFVWLVFWQCWGLNSRPCSCLPLKPSLQPFLLWEFFQIASQVFLSRTGLIACSSYLYLLHS
jgi:hypothetical protein